MSAGAWAPLQRPVFRALWIASIFSNMGTWMQEIGAGWLMVSLAPDPVMVALVQAATALPVFLLSIPAGAAADLIERRRYLVATQAWMASAAVLLGVLAVAGLVGPWTLLALTVLLASGSAMMTPAWVATLPDLVPRGELQSAMTLNSLSLNVSRTTGPALAGVIVAVFGSGWTFILNAATLIVSVAVLLRWKREAPPPDGPRESLGVAIRAGARYVRTAHGLQATMVRAFAFYVGSMALWALMPLIARDRAGGGAMTYGLLHGAIGGGALVAVLLLPWARRRWSPDRFVARCTVVYAAGMAVPGLVTHPVLIAAGMALCGLAWVSVLASLHVAGQAALPPGVRARATAYYLMSFAAGSVAGSTLWGAVAARTSLPFALLAASVVSLLLIVPLRRFRLDAVAPLS